MSERPDTTDYRALFLSPTPMMDMRAPAEFTRGAFASALSLPLMSDDERAQVGICYKQQGQAIHQTRHRNQQILIGYPLHQLESPLHHQPLHHHPLHYRGVGPGVDLGRVRVPGGAGNNRTRALKGSWGRLDEFVAMREARVGYVAHIPKTGGTSIEDIAEKDPSAIIKMPIDIIKGMSKADAIELAKKMRFSVSLI